MNGKTVIRKAAGHWIRDYSVFDYGEENKLMGLAEATRLAAHLAAQDSRNFYRVVPANRAQTRFRIAKVSKAKEWARYHDRMVKGSKEESVPYSYSFNVRF